MSVNADLMTRDKTFRYQLLDRMRIDIDYCKRQITGFKEDQTFENKNEWSSFLNNHLWGGTETHFSTMKGLLESFSEDELPEWYSIQQLQSDKRELEEICGMELS
ncbi:MULTISPECIES: LPD11 domain-containing protein [unclassified Enterococcus]|uniref:LPD11 domain-containing protein n=1 Tax=unclassified Enterococcus TaxID=2608891 RepID=UPI0019058909|nr:MULTISPECIES: LPD11 domain-containing protein [unclassified Enterococcus]MBK0036042.1 hypothetical protein [Enterococcus sp. S52]MBK0068700.1 hypothetical protein [Enterococcus sp. S53]MBK0139293.1 hypothetical protein [Enterococcus sp. S76]MBK0142928.1 hypothetical protein [Enterococcus sp. S77]